MKIKTIFIIIFLLFSSIGIYGQGTTSDPYSSTGWDAATAYSTHYSLEIARLLSNPGGLYNRNTRTVDSLLNALIVYTDSSQMYIQNDTLKFSDRISGMNAFTTTAEYDTVLVSGIDSSDIVTVSAREAIPGANDLLGVYLKSDTLIVGRAASGTSGLKYNWIWIRKN